MFKDRRILLEETEDSDGRVILGNISLGNIQQKTGCFSMFSTLNEVLNKLQVKAVWASNMKLAGQEVSKFI